MEPNYNLTAILTLITAARSDKQPTPAQLKRVIKACRHIGLDETGIFGVLYAMDIVDSGGRFFRDELKPVINLTM